MDEGEIAAVLSHYPVGSIRRITLAAGGMTNENFFVETDQGQFFLRKRNVSFTPESIDFELGLIDHLAGDGFPTAPVIRTLEGELRSEHKGRHWELYRRIPGGKFNVEDLEQVKSAARLLARFHKDLSDYGFRPVSIEDRNVDLTRIAQLIGQFEEEAGRRSGPLGSVLVPPLAGFFRRHANIVVDCIQPLSSVQKTMIHGDFQPSNVLFHGSDAAAVIDFGDTSLFYRAYDVAKAILRFATLKPGYRSQMDVASRLDLSRTRAFIDAYQSELPLSEVELRAMPALLHGVYLYDVGFFMGAERSILGKLAHLIRAWRFMLWLRRSRGEIMEILLPGKGEGDSCPSV